MKLIEWLKRGDPVIADLVDRDLLGINTPYHETGYVKRYLDLYVSAERGWGYGLYSPKWVSDHYTLLELKDMEIDPAHPIYRQAALNVLSGMWYKGVQKTGRKRHFDMCMAAMMLDICVYCRLADPRLDEIVDYILSHPMGDGGWNCGWDSPVLQTKSSLHTTLSVLEAFRDYRTNGYSYRLGEIAQAIPAAEEFILRKRLYRSVRTGEIIHRDMAEFHYPPRWKYDAFRALDYFASVGHPYDVRMDEATDIIRTKMARGFIGRGNQYSNRIHFDLETGKGGRFNTLRALKILKRYDPACYRICLERDVEALGD